MGERGRRGRRTLVSQGEEEKVLVLGTLVEVAGSSQGGKQVRQGGKGGGKGG